MKYKEIIGLNKSFQYSINLQYDLTNLEKVIGYIPTKQSTGILKEYLTSIYKDTNDKATVLIGPYGKGKSHLLLVLMGILTNKDPKVKNALLKKFKGIKDKEAFDLVNIVLNKDKKFLPIIINSNNFDLKQSFLIALNEAIKREQLDEIELNTYFDAVIDIINLWQREYPETIEKLERELEKFKINLDVFINQIKSYSSDAYQMFVNIYPILVSGIEFNPMINTDIVKLYEDFNNKICTQYGYNGTFIIFDEFSKFIEASSDKNNSGDLKILQDFAEVANRSKENQIHLTCITHKSINQYISKLPTNKIDAWRAIEGRFKEIYFTTSSKQNFDLIGNTIKVTDVEKVTEILNLPTVEGHYSKAFSLYEDTYEEKEYLKEIKENCFPLNAVTTYCLPRISEKVAQNERTLFTFLCKQGNNTLWSFIRKADEGELLEVDTLYDYFEILFKKEIFNEKIREVWMKTDSILKKLDKEDEIKVIKAIAIINIVDDFEKLKPARSILKYVFNEKVNVEEAIQRLLEKGVLIERKNNNILEYMPGISLDVNQYISDLAKTKFKKANIADELNKNFRLDYITPKRYNDENLMTRFFENKYIEAEELLGYEKIDDTLEGMQGDGVILNLIYKNPDLVKEVKEKLNLETSRNIILNIPIESFSKEQDLVSLLAVRQLKSDEAFLEKDESIFEYLEIIEEDLVESITQELEKKFEIDNLNTEIIVAGRVERISTQEDFNKFISTICNKVFDKTVKINNEMINKNKITAPILKARNKIIDSLLEGEVKLEGNSPEVTIARATLKNKGLLNNDEEMADVKLILETIKKIILGSEKVKCSFKEIYDYLEKCENGIRMRRGVIPIYIALAFKEFSEKIVIYFGNRNPKEVEIDSKLFNSINEKPEEYFFKLDSGTKESEMYFENLDNVFKAYASRNKERNKYVQLLRNMQEWVKSLDNFTRNHTMLFLKNEKIPKEYEIFRRELLKYDINSREFIFEVLPKILKEKDYKKVLEKVLEIKKYYEDRSRTVTENVIKITTDTLVSGYKGSLSAATKKWSTDLDKYKKEYLYDVITNRLLEFIDKLRENNDENIVEELSFILTGLSIKDWNDGTYTTYKKSLENCLDKIENLEEVKESSSNEETVTVKLTGATETEKRFTKEEISPLGSTLLNELEEVVEEYGSSLDDNEKRTILFKLLENLM